jgi:tRNA (guanine10-N2)-dimethyltransferase
MKFLFQLSGEHPRLPRAELEAVLLGEGLRYRVLFEDASSRILVVDLKSSEWGFVGRLALTKKACEFAASSGSLEEVARKLYPQLCGRTFKVECRSERVSKKLGGLLYGMGLKVDVHAPSALVHCFITKEGFLAGLEIPLDRRFEQRKPQHRPFFHPTSMHPKVARALVNLARVKTGEKVLDPFCGTGGILIEAALMGMKVYGCDIDSKMVEGSRSNLRHFGVSGTVTQEDALSCDIKADAIVTDPPYGRASSVAGRDSKKLFQEFIEHAGGLLQEGRFMVLVSPKEYALSFPAFSEEASYDLRMHRSLTRRVWVLRKT